MDLSTLGGTDHPWHPLHPASPWMALPDDTPAAGQPFIYFASPRSAYLCRDVMRMNGKPDPGGPRWADNKSDPNLETLTYGMWSTCSANGRAKFGETSGRYAFFYSAKDGGNSRHFTGFYDVGWTFDSWYVLLRTNKTEARIGSDRFLAARKAHFVPRPIPIDEAQAALGCDEEVLQPRNIRKLDVEEATALRNLMLEQDDSTEHYLAEIQELEETILTATNGRSRYVNWDRVAPFTWEHAGACFGRGPHNRPTQEMLDIIRDAGIRPGYWRCLRCGNGIQTERPIKNCSQCPDGGIMVPRTEKTWSWPENAP